MSRPKVYMVMDPPVWSMNLSITAMNSKTMPIPE